MRATKRTPKKPAPKQAAKTQHTFTQAFNYAKPLTMFCVELRTYFKGRQEFGYIELKGVEVDSGVTQSILMSYDDLLALEAAVIRGKAMLTVNA